jgi:hypothetical protein
MIVYNGNEPIKIAANYLPLPIKKNLFIGFTSTPPPPTYFTTCRLKDATETCFN